MKFLKRILQQIFRESATSILFILGLTVSCFILINVAELIEKINKENKVLNNFKYTASSYLDGTELFYNCEDQITISNNLTKLVTSRLSEETSGNTYLELQVNVNEKIDTYAANIVMQLNEDAKINCNKDYDVTEENGIIIGEDLLQFTTDKDGIRTIVIGGNTMKVIGIMKNEMSGGVDNTIYIFWDNCDEQMKEYINNIITKEIKGILKFTYRSEQDTTNAYKDFVNDMEKNGFKVFIIDAYYEGDYQNFWYRTYNSIFMGISLILSILNCFTVSYLWLINRKKELAIRKAYGYSILQITGMMIKDVIKLCIPACILAEIVQFIYTTAIGREVFTGQVFMKILFVCIGMLIITIVNSLYMIRHVKKVSPVSVLTEN